MFHPVTPLDVFQQQTDRLGALVPGMLDGDLDSIHDARIATRRIREALPLTHEWQRPAIADGLQALCRRLGRSLGRVRDADVQIELLQQFEPRHPHASAALVRLRQGQEQQRRHLMRKLIKESERLGLSEELARLASRHARHSAGLWVRRNGLWRHQLRHLIAMRGAEAGAAVSDTTGVYFPNRAHQARIAIKKFRYATEIGAQTGVMVDEPLIRALKKAQDLLGRVHDRQTLIDESTLAASEDKEISEAHIRELVQAASADIHDLYRRYLAKRAGILCCCERAEQRVRSSSGVPVAALALGGIIALTGLEARRRRGLSSAFSRESEDASEPGGRRPLALAGTHGL
jgi:CHAD domain-containing protein